MNDIELYEFKAVINADIDFAIREMGGLDAVREQYALMPGLLDFIAGWVARSYWIHRQAQLQRRLTLTQEEKRRLYDLVRLKLDTGSSTS